MHGQMHSWEPLIDCFVIFQCAQFLACGIVNFSLVTTVLRKNVVMLGLLPFVDFQVQWRKISKNNNQPVQFIISGVTCHCPVTVALLGWPQIDSFIFLFLFSHPARCARVVLVFGLQHWWFFPDCCFEMRGKQKQQLACAFLMHHLISPGCCFFHSELKTTNFVVTLGSPQ